jgi:pimeloyl-ACP methyl ester carboxylesterase
MRLSKSALVGWRWRPLRYSRSMKRVFLPVLLLFLLAACSSIPSPRERQLHANALAIQMNWQSLRLRSGRFDLLAYVPRHIGTDETLTIYIEGDGFAWVSGSMPSADPTPREPLALKLALAHPGGNAAYLARPCQYVDAEQPPCAQHYWTEMRFAEEVIVSENFAVDALKQHFGARRLVLVGYSGGGAVAALLAARRDDVTRLVTVAGNLDHRAWTAHHRVAPLSGSHNAADVAERLAHLPQTHYVGAKDRVIPPELSQHWPHAIIGPQAANLHVIPDADHACCFAKQWQLLFTAIK